MLATSTQSLSTYAIGGAGGSTAGVAGSATVTVVDDTTIARIGDRPAGAQADAEVRAGTGTGTTGDVVIKADSTLDLLSTAGALAFGGKAGVGAGVDAGSITRRTDAVIGRSAKVSADGAVRLEAEAESTITTVSVAGVGSGKVAVGLTAGVSVLNLPTRAWIDAGAEVVARGSVLVQAFDKTTSDLVVGSLSGAGGVAVGVAAGVGVVNKTTSAWIEGGARVTALGVNGTVTAYTGGFSGANGSDSATTANNKEFLGSALDATSGRITVAGHGFSTGDRVVYGADRAALGGLSTGQRYFVISDGANQFRLAATLEDAQADRALTLGLGASVAGDRHTVERLGDVGVPSIDNEIWDSTGLANSRQGTPITEARRGLVVGAISVNDFESAGAAGGGAGTVAVQVAGGIAVHRFDTTAEIRAGARVNETNTGASADQSVRVIAARSYHNLTLGIGASFAGAAAVAPAVAVPVLEGDTAARIIGGTGGANGTIVNARADVEVAATARADFISIAAGISGAGKAGIAGSAAVIVVDTLTEAAIRGGARVEAGDNVAVLATDDTVGYGIAGAVGIGGGGGGAGALVVMQISKRTEALIENGAQVDALAQRANAVGGVAVGDITTSGAIQTASLRGVAVQAVSRESLTSVAAGAAGGLYVGLAGSVTVGLVNSDTLAAIRDGAAVNVLRSSAASVAQSVAVGARNTLETLSIAGALGVGKAGVGAGVDVGVHRNDTQALITDAAAHARGTVSVNALSVHDIRSNAVGVGAGLFGLGGGIVVLSVGGNFGATYSASGESGSGSANALEGPGGTDVIGELDAALREAVQELLAPGEGDVPSFGPSAVDDTTDTITLSAPHGLQTGDAVVYRAANGSPPLAGLEDGRVYFAIVDSPTRLRLAASQGEATAGDAIDIGRGAATGTAHRLAASGVGIGSGARDTASAQAPAANFVGAGTGGAAPMGTTAAVDGGAVVNATSLDVDARQKSFVQVVAGGLAGGVGGLGVGVAVVTLDSRVTAFVGPAATILGAGGGTLTVDAARVSDTRVLGNAGVARGFLSLGAAVAYVTDSSSVRALVGARVAGDTIVEGSATGFALVGGAGFTRVTVQAVADNTHRLATGAASFSVGLSAGAAITYSTINGSVEAVIGANAVLGSDAAPVGEVNVLATRDNRVGPFNSGDPFAIGIAGGAIGGGAGVGDVTIGGAVRARIGDAVVIRASQALVVRADEDSRADIRLDGGAIGIVAVGTMIARITATVETTARIGARADLLARRVTVEAKSNLNGTASADPLAGGIFAGSGSVSEVRLTPTVSAAVGEDATIRAVERIEVLGTATNTASSTANGRTYAGAFTVGISRGEAYLTTRNTVSVGAGARLLSGGSLALTAETTETADANSTGGVGSSIAVARAETTLTIDTRTRLEVAAGARLEAEGDADLTARTTIDAESRPTVNSGGVGVDTETTARLTITNVTAVDFAGDLSADRVNVTAVANITATSRAFSKAEALGADSDATATLTTTSDAQITLQNGSDLTGQTALTLTAQHRTLRTDAESVAETQGLGGDSDPTVTNNLTARSTITARANATVSGRDITVQVLAPETSSFLLSADQRAAVIDTGSSVRNTTIVDQRLIDWNGRTVFLGLPNPLLEVDAAGNIIRNIGLNARRVGDQIVVPDFAYTGNAGGNIRFVVAPATRYTFASDVTKNVTSTARLIGAPTFVISLSVDRIDILNASAVALQLNGINPVNPLGTGAVNLSINAPDSAGFTPVTTTQTARTIITVTSTQATDILLRGAILNAHATSTVTMTTAGGRILQEAPGARLVTNALTLEAGAGRIGTEAAPLVTRSSSLRAIGAQGVAIAEEDGLLIERVAAVGGTATLSSGGAITQTGTGTAVEAQVISLAAAGGIGNSALLIDATAALAALDATAGGPILITDVAGGLAVGVVSAAMGGITLATRDSAAMGEDILLSAGSSITASGAVSLSAGDDVRLLAGSTITGASLVAAVDAGNADVDGGTVEAFGTLSLPLATFRGGAEGDLFLLRALRAGTALTIDALGGDDVLRVGSLASRTGNAGGVLANIQGSVTFAGGTGNDRLSFDDTGAPSGRAGTVTGGGVTGFGTGGVGSTDVERIALALGGGDDAVTVADVPQGRTEITLGGGNDTAL
ncbi:MAG: hypothetical protein MUF60_00715, partial [Vicinamibacterales bacterium]|nr:hypothetical protein [Vicinamibacterales bacterium]